MRRPRPPARMTVFTPALGSDDACHKSTSLSDFGLIWGACALSLHSPHHASRETEKRLAPVAL